MGGRGYDERCRRIVRVKETVRICCSTNGVKVERISNAFCSVDDGCNIQSKARTNQKPEFLKKMVSVTSGRHVVFVSK